MTSAPRLRTRDELRSRRSRRVATLLTLAPCLLIATGCGKVKARFEMKKAISSYKEGQFRVALEQFQRGIALDPALQEQWRSVGYSAMALYHPGERDKHNQELAATAVDAFGKYLKVRPDDPKVTEYLTGLLIDAGRIDEALARLKADSGSADRQIQQQANRAIVSVLIREKRMDDAWAWATRSGAPRDHVPLLTIGVTNWNAAYRDPMLDTAARGAIVERGLAALLKVTELAPQLPEGAVYYNLMLREKAKLTEDPLEAQKLYDEAERWRTKAKVLMAAQKPASPGA